MWIPVEACGDEGTYRSSLLVSESESRDSEALFFFSRRRDGKRRVDYVSASVNRRAACSVSTRDMAASRSLLSWSFRLSARPAPHATHPPCAAHASVHRRQNPRVFPLSLLQPRRRRRRRRRHRLRHIHARLPRRLLGVVRAPFREFACGVRLERSRCFRSARLVASPRNPPRCSPRRAPVSSASRALRERSRRVFQRRREVCRVLLLRGAHGVFGLRLRVLDVFCQALDLQTGPSRLFLVLLAHLARPSRRLVQGLARVRQTRVVLLLARQELSLGPVARA